MSKFTFLFFVFVLITTFNVSAEPKINARTAILMDYDSEEILFELDPDHQIYPASMTKIMTSIIAFDLIKQKKISLDDKFLISENAWRLSQSGYSSMFIMINDEVSVNDLLMGIIVASGNDACVALAEGIAGTEENFVTMMNDKALEIGMTNTIFGNSSGIDGVTNLSTVRDIALMSKYLIKNYPNYYKMYSEKVFTWSRTGGDPITQYNRNTLLNRNLGVDGIKTGFLSLEKYSLASTIKKDSRRLISVGSGFISKKSRAVESMKLLSWGLRNTETYEISKKDETIFEIKTWQGKNKFIEGITKDDVYVTVNKKNLRTFKIMLEYEGPIKAPIKKDAEIAKINIYNGDKIIDSYPLYAKNKLSKVNFLSSLFSSLNYLIWGDV
tara:strand:+ start:1168 stop:2319 length:1152 start_codon:yes stop_codon:yes gene_type:complete